ncbi:MAG: alpha/beta fold hydrolase [Phormidesmis sp.]
MFFNAQNKRVLLQDTEMDYVVFGQGLYPLVILPGLSDGLQTVRGQAMLLAWYYRQFSKDFRVYIFSRKNKITQGYTTREMAKDQQKVLHQLDIERAFVMGVSQGGMVAQYLAIEFPDLVKRLVIAVSISRPNMTIQAAVESWKQMATADDYKSLIIDTMEKTFSARQLRKYRPFYPVISRLGKPNSFRRFLIQAEACLDHDAYGELNRITCPTLVIGGGSDLVVGPNSSEEMAAQIEDSQLVIYPELGHGAYEETKDFNRQVKRFLLSASSRAFPLEHFLWRKWFEMR